ncbi:MAG: hypothetical protein JXA96_13775 [Sedimentisphaerales bacterium]|nr:hypothetical protein [Sedimentisphaerales bacterium]
MVIKRIIICYRAIFYVLFAVFLLSTGCNAPKSDLNKFNESFRSEALGPGNFSKTVQIAQSKQTQGKNPKKEDLLWALQAAALERMNKNYQQSNEYFDKAETMLNYFDYQNETIDSAAAIITNENIVPYVGDEYDGIMINTYKALNFMALGNNELARVEFNRALERQKRAAQKFAAEIAKLKKEIDKEDTAAKDNVDNPQVQDIVKSSYPSLYDFKAYPDFINPFTNYIAGIFFNLDGDHSKATQLLKEAYGMVSDNDFVGEDFALTEQVLDGQKEFKNMVWVIFENGMGPVKEEFRIDIPLFIEGKRNDKKADFKYFGIALPKLVFRDKAFSYLTIETENKSVKTQEVANMDRVIQTEFEKDFKGILTRAIISATSKAVAQYALTKNSDSGSQVISLLAAAYTFATTAADVRIWTTLPKDFQVARMDIPENRLITVSPPGGNSFQVEIPPCNNALVYVKIPFRQAKPVYDIMKF